MKVITDEKRIEEVLNIGVEEVIEKEHLIASMKSGKRLNIKFGIDPTMPDLHLGHSVPLRKLRAFQDLGHLAILIIGDTTAMIGDPSGRSETRKILSSVMVKENMKNYLKQAAKILDIKKTEIKYNSEWLDNNMVTILELSKAGSIQQILHRSDFKKRIDNDEDITILEMLYPLLQGYDSVAVKADLEIGGTDQKFNLLAGRRVQRFFKVPEQDILTLPLLEGVDGIKKMSKSYGNYIALDEKPEEMYGKVMSLPDSLIIKYFNLCTSVPREEIVEIKKEMESEKLNPKEAKMRLASEIVKIYHGEKKAKEAEENFINTFQKKEIPESVEEIEGEGLLAPILFQSKLFGSNSEIRRLFEAGAVKDMTNDEKMSIENIAAKGHVYKIGKHRFVKII